MTTPRSTDPNVAPPRTPTANTPGASPSPGNQAFNPTVSYTLSPQDASRAAAANSTSSFFRFLLAYTVVIVIAVAVNKTRLGHLVIYYSLALLLLLQLVLNYKWFQQAIAPLTGQGKNQQQSGSGQGGQ